jgi:hypothetical protein
MTFKNTKQRMSNTLLEIIDTEGYDDIISLILEKQNKESTE